MRMPPIAVIRGSYQWPAKNVLDDADVQCKTCPPPTVSPRRPCHGQVRTPGRCREAGQRTPPCSPLPDRPDFSWPGGKRLAVCINNNIEVFSFLSGLGSDSASVTAPQTTRNYAWRDYGNRVGQWYVFDLLEEYGLPASHNVNSILITECPQITARIKERGDEFIGHGRTNAERQDALNEGKEKQLIDDATETLKRYTGRQPDGWMGP
jgi:allantoinase